jgi:anti-sigma B factor antagonist
VSLEYTIRHRAGTAAVDLSGRIDGEAGTVLADAYEASIRKAPTAIRLDFGAVDYINSTGIALIVGLLARARAESIPVQAAGLTPHYQHIFAITRLSDFIEILAPAEK